MIVEGTQEALRQWCDAQGRLNGLKSNPVVSARFDDLGADGKPARLGIMGGTFDPIHVGHLACAEQAREAFGLDAVVFVPTGNPAFKRNRSVTPAQHRLEMCRRAVLPNPHFDVSDMEIARGGVTYAIDTVRVLRDHFPDNVELFFITGADSILSIARWRQSAEMARMIRFIAVTRPGFTVSDSFKEELSALGDYDVSYLEVTALAISSSDLRARVAAGHSLRYLTMLSVCDYIHCMGLYKHQNAETDERINEGTTDMVDAKYEDALSLEFYEARKSDLTHRVSAKRFRHIEGVAQVAEQLARIYGVDLSKARLAGLLHDWDKGMNDAEITARVDELGLRGVLDPWVVDHMPAVLHGHTAAVALAREFPSIPQDVIQAIDRHTTAAIDMTSLDMVVYIADAVEPNRQYGRIDELRSLVGQVDLEELFFRTYEYWVFLLFERRKPLHPATITVWNEYVARRAARKETKRDR